MLATSPASTTFGKEEAMARGKFGWERDEAFDEKRIRLAESLLDLRTGLIIILVGVVFLLLVFFVAPLILFRGLTDVLALAVLMGLFGALAYWFSNLVGVTSGEDGPGPHDPGASVVQRPDTSENGEQT
jgi:hypothetical protein